VFYVTTVCCEGDKSSILFSCNAAAQIAVIEFARNVLGMAEANSTEIDQVRCFRVWWAGQPHGVSHDDVPAPLPG
jgi:hypothetical protein